MSKNLHSHMIPKRISIEDVIGHRRREIKFEKIRLHMTGIDLKLWYRPTKFINLLKVISMQTVPSENQVVDQRIKFNESFNASSKFNSEQYENIKGNLIHKTAIINWERVRIGRAML